MKNLQATCRKVADTTKVERIPCHKDANRNQKDHRHYSSCTCEGQAYIELNRNDNFGTHQFQTCGILEDSGRRSVIGNIAGGENFQEFQI